MARTPRRKRQKHAARRRRVSIQTRCSQRRGTNGRKPPSQKHAIKKGWRASTADRVRKLYTDETLACYASKSDELDTERYAAQSQAETDHMGDAARRKSQFLKLHPLCVYCGSAAKTTDHCPPRCFFLRRDWPETYEFPACELCNAGARLDEQALAVLIRTPLREERDETDQREWDKLVDGVRNNQPQVLSEWRDVSQNEIKRDLRSTFGRELGDLLRQRGWGVANIGPLTQGMITRLMIKLSKALYYKHNGHVLDGILYVHHVDVTARDTTPEYIKGILRMAPAVAAIERNRKPLSEQFIYRFNYSPEAQVMYAVVQFGDQFIFQLIAMGREMHEKLVELNGGKDLPNAGRHECYLTKNQASDG